MWFAIFKHLTVGPVLRVLTRPRLVGGDQIPDSGPVIIAANHLAVIDSLILCLVIRRRLTFVAKSEYFEQSGVRGAALRWFLTVAGQIPIDRAGADASRAALNTACRVVESEGAWAIHPEGTRSRDGLAHRGKTGVMRVAQRTGAVVVPVGIRGTSSINPPGSRLVRPGRVEVVVGKPMRPDFGVQSVREATDELMRTLTVLSAQDYCDEYASR